MWTCTSYCLDGVHRGTLSFYHFTELDYLTAGICPRSLRISNTRLLYLTEEVKYFIAQSVKRFGFCFAGHPMPTGVLLNSSQVACVAAFDSRQQRRGCVPHYQFLFERRLFHW